MEQLNSISAREYASSENLYPSGDIYSAELTANTEFTLSVPTGAQIAIFGYTDEVWVNYDTTASIPTGGFTKAGGEPKPKMRYIGDVSVLHFIAPRTCKCSVAFYSK